MFITIEKTMHGSVLQEQTEAERAWGSRQGLIDLERL